VGQPLWAAMHLTAARRYACPVAGPTNLNDPAAVIDLFVRAAATLRADPRRDGSVVRLPPRGRLLATGDLHDNPIHFAAIVRLARLEASPDHHLVLHELIHGDRLINGMDFSHRMLARVAELILRHPGQVHPMLANHELAQITGQGVSKGAGDNVKLFNDALDYVFSDQAEAVDRALRGFLSSLPLAVIGGDAARCGAVMCAHSLPAAAAMNGFDLSLLGRELTDADFRGPHGGAYTFTWGRRHTPEQIEQLAAAWGVRLFCLGHQHVETGIEMKHPRVIVLNSDHEFGAVLPLNLADVPTAEDALQLAIPLRAVA
jgi:Calcineurin-like phosphoesterase